jgi:prepilin-type N-terminal cleavage/methylation domain-containing protein
MRRGVTLFELLVAIALIGLLAGIVTPRAALLADRIAVEHEAGRLLVAHRTAWLFARTHHRLALLRVTPDSLAVRIVSSAGAPDTALVWIGPGPGRAGVQLTSAPHTTVLAPDGVAMGLANHTHVLTRGGATRRVVVSRLGRVRVVP